MMTNEEDVPQDKPHDSSADVYEVVDEGHETIHGVQRDEEDDRYQHL